MESWLLGLPTVKDYNGLKLSDLPLNHAYVTANTTVENVGVYAVRDNCYNCPYELQRYLKAGQPASWMMNTGVQYLLRIMRADEFNQVARNNRRGILCQMRPTMREYGVYKLDVGRCELKPEVEPVNSYMPLYLSLLILLILYLFYGLFMYFKNKGNKQDKVLQINTDKNDNNMRSLYYFRDFIMACLIFATTGGGGYPAFNYEWGGLSLGDCLFFAYAWSIGVYIPSVMNEACGRRTKCAVFKDIFKRAFVLLFLGTALDSTAFYRSGVNNIPLWSPLQRLGIAYFIVASIYLLTMQKFEMKSKRTICKAIGNLVSLMWCWVFAGFLLAIYIIFISTFASFNCLANAPLEQRPDYANIVPEATLNCNNESSEFANRIFVSEAKKIVDVTSYVGFSHGLMGTMSTILYTMIGLKAGIVFLHYKSHADRLKLWVFWATLFNLGGIIFAGVSYPLNFNLWPISTVIFVSSTALYLLSFIYLLLEVWNLGAVLMSNARTSASLVVLAGHLLFSNSLPFRWGIHIRQHYMFLLQNFWIVFLWMVINRILSNRVKFQI